MRRWKKGGKVGMELVKDGWEPLLMHLLLLLHPAVCRCRGALTDLKGSTRWGRGLGLEGVIRLCCKKSM